MLVDQVTKAVALRSLGESHGPVRGAGRVLRLVVNERPIFARAGGGRALVALWVLAVASAVLALTAGAGLGAHELAGIGLALALGGAASNLGDRLTRGAVVDFIALGWWPIFNIADVAIVAGALVAIGSLV